MEDTHEIEHFFPVMALVAMIAVAAFFLGGYAHMGHMATLAMVEHAKKALPE